MKRDIARRRMVYHSSSYNKDLCGHLVTGGNPNDRRSKSHFTFVEQHSDAVQDIEHLVDEQNTTYWCSPHRSTHFDIVFDAPVQAKGYRLFSNQYDTNLNPTEWRLSGSLDGEQFVELDYHKCEEMTPFLYTYITKEPILWIDSSQAYRVFRFEILDNFGQGEKVALGEFDLIGIDNCSLLRTFDGHFEQCYMSKGNEEEYLILDLGTDSRIEEIILDWGMEYATWYEIFVSNDGESWCSCYENTNGQGKREQFDLSIQGRYLKLLLHRSIGAHFILYKWQVLGENDLAPKQSAWKIERASEVEETGEVISTADFCDADWFPAIVPGTVLTSHMTAGAVCDYNNDDNYTQHSDAFFTTNWWYRTSFRVEDAKRGKRIWLNFDAINWKAAIYLNGVFIGDIHGAFLRKKIDITSLVQYGEENYLAVLIYCNHFPGPQKIVGLDYPHFINGGVTGLDEPCLAAGIGWDWITTVSGRNIGIYKDVYLSYTEDVQLLDPWFETCKVDYRTGHARVAFRTEVSNATEKLVIATVKCKINDGAYSFSKEVVLPPNKQCEVEVTDVIIQNAKLWYPVGYGSPELYKAEITVSVNEAVSDEKTIHFGIRKIEYLFNNDILSLQCNGKKICCVGGNWGMDDATLQNDARDYDIEVRLHADQNFNMIRNWVGQTNDEAFYTACDKHGVMVWDDFWLANPGDGPEPLDVDMFMENAKDKVRKVRNHPSVVLYCGRNEGEPTEPLATMLPELIREMDPGRLYISHSAEGVVSGYGPYHAQEKEYYFVNTGKTIHSERGTPNIPVVESIQRFLSPKNQWPICDTWVAHSFIIAGAQFCGKFCERLRALYGDYNSLEEFVRKSQMLCYETYKAIFEAERASEGGGMLLWMSTPAMPSFAFQTYDYYYAINGGYMGAKLANQPLYAYRNPVTGKIMLDNRSGRDAEQVSVTCRLFDIKGALLWEKSEAVALCKTGQSFIEQLQEYKDTVFLKTEVQTGTGEVYRNFEWIYSDCNKTTGLELLEKATVAVKVTGNTFTVENVGLVPALQIQLSLLHAKTKESILPVFWSDNFISLMPGEKQEITYSCYDDIENTEIDICVSGFNLNQFFLTK